jgi:lysophospholipase L1-like esterase
VRSPKHWLFLCITLLTPFFLLGAAEVITRLAWPEGALPLFVTAPFGDGEYLIANRRVARRWFAGDDTVPAPMAEPFAAHKPARGFRVFVLGESTTAGFPYPRNGAFSRSLRDMLRDVLPDDSVEVINLGIAATNSYALVDIADEVLEHEPDAIVIYAGHNEYYGALGAASTEAVVGTPGMVRLYLALLRSRAVLAFRAGLSRLRTSAPRNGTDDAASRMETMARDREIGLNGKTYHRGVRQFEVNLQRVTRAFRRAGVPVFIGSLASNLRDQPPLAAPANRGPGNAEGSYLDAQRSFSAGKYDEARRAYERARDLDVVRFRAPAEFNAVIERVARRTGVTYVPIAEAVARDAPGGIPGSEFFLEHVHPNRGGHATMARVFFESMRDAGFGGRNARLDALRAWSDYRRAMELTAFDERVVAHVVRTLTTRWPFVSAVEGRDYRGTYRPTDLFDSLAFAVSGGATWETAKLRVAAEYERLGRFADAVAEYRGLARDAPLFEEPLRLLGRSLLAAGDTSGAERMLEQATQRKPTAYSSYMLGTLALKRRQLPRAIVFLHQSQALGVNEADVLHQLSIAYALAGDVGRARTAAARLQRIAPRRPGLDEWLRALGMAP